MLLTLPAPQALALFGDGDLDPAARRLLETVETAPSIAVMLRGQADAPAWQAIQLRDAAVTWLAVDSDKREGPPPAAGRIFVLHGSGPFSREWQDGDMDEAARRIVGRAGELVGDWITQLPDRQNPPLALFERAARAEGPAVPEHGERSAVLRGRQL